jgi:hypothetical protein
MVDAPDLFDDCRGKPASLLARAEPATRPEELTVCLPRRIPASVENDIIHAIIAKRKLYEMKATAVRLMRIGVTIN